MDKIKKLSAVTAVLAVFLLNSFVMAENDAAVEINDQNLLISETDLTNEANSSDINVNVISSVNGVQTTIYSGALSGYANGMFADADFEEIQYIVLMDWESTDDEVIYIIPAEQQNISAESSINISTMQSLSADNTVQSNLQSNTGTITTNMGLVYDNVYHENVLLPGKTLSIPVTVTNTGSTDKQLVSYIAKYNLSGRLTELTEGSIITAPANQTVTATLSEAFSSDTACTAKVFMWEKDTMKPVSDTISLTIENQDYYADSMTNAQLYDISKTINGKINSGSDIDYVKFVPSVSGSYIIQTIGTSNTSGILYNSEQTVIANGSDSGVSNNFYIKATLVAGEIYYIGISGKENSTGDYSLTVAPCNQMVQVGVCNNIVILSGDISASLGTLQSAKINLLNSDDDMLSTKDITTSDNGYFSAEIPVSLETGQYKLIISANGNIIEVIELNVLKDIVEFDVNGGEFCSVPFVVTNASALSNVYFSLGFNSDDFEIYDVCDYTQEIENGTGLITSAYTNVLEKSDSYCIFKSTRTVSDWSGTANVIKLKARRNATMDTIRYVYQVK